MADPIGSEYIALKNTSIKDIIIEKRDSVDLSKYIFVGTFFDKDCYFLLENLEHLNQESADLTAEEAEKK